MNRDNKILHLIEHLISLELGKILTERKRVAPQIMYHGTSSKFLPKIFQMGIIPEPSEGKWKDSDLERDTSYNRPSLRSLKGSYWTDNLSVALSAASNTRRKVGGKSMIVVAQIVPQSGYADEDDLRSPVQRAFSETVAEAIGIREPFDSAWKIKGLVDSNKKIYNQLVNSFGNKLHASLTKNDKKPISHKLMKEVFDAFLERVLAHKSDDAATYYNKADYLDYFKIGLERSGMNEGDVRKKIDSIKSNPLPKFNKITAEKRYLDALEKLTIRYRESALPGKEDEDWRMRTNVRIPHNVGFSGRNKIISIVVISRDGKKLYPAYGQPSKEFVQEYSKYWGPDFIIVDTASKIEDVPKS